MGFHNEVMESNHFTFELSSANPRPGLSFMLGTVVVVIFILVATTIFLCCYHWAKLVRNAVADHEAGQQPNTAVMKPADHTIFITLEPLPSLPVVYMPGDDMPSFVAMRSPYVAEET